MIRIFKNILQLSYYGQHVFHQAHSIYKDKALVEGVMILWSDRPFFMPFKGPIIGCCSSQNLTDMLKSVAKTVFL